MSDVSKISPDLSRKMREEDPTKAVGVIVLLKSLGHKEEKKQKPQDPSKEEMLSFLQRLEELKRGGESIMCQPYEALSSAYVRARPDVILKLTDFSEVHQIIDNPAVTLLRPAEGRAFHRLTALPSE
jgi:hypothetical protein